MREIEQFVRAMIENVEPDPDENMRPGRGRPQILPVCTIMAISGKEETPGTFPAPFSVDPFLASYLFGRCLALAPGHLTPGNAHGKTGADRRAGALLFNRTVESGIEIAKAS